MSMDALRDSMRSPYFLTASDRVGAGSDATAGLPGGTPGRLVISSGAKVRLKSYSPRMPVSSTTGRLVKREVTPTSVNRLADGAVIVTADADPPNITIDRGFPSVPMAMGCSG